MVQPTSPAARLRAAIKASPYSIRGFGKALAARPDVTANEDSVHRTIAKKLSGKEAVGDYWGPILEDQLGLEDGALRDDDYARALSQAMQVFRRLDAGEEMLAEDLLAMAGACDEVIQQTRLIARRLRHEAKARQPAGS